MDTQSDVTAMRRWVVVMPRSLRLVVLATPALRALHARHPQAQIILMVQPALRSWVEDMPWVHGLVDAPRGVWSHRRLLRQIQPDVVMLLVPCLHAVMGAWLAGVPRRIGYDHGGRGFMLTDRLLHPPLSGAQARPLTAHDYLAMVRYLGDDAAPRPVKLFTADAQDHQTQVWLRGHGWDATQPLVVFDPASGPGNAAWHAASFAQLADRFAAQGIAVALWSMPGTHAPIRDIAQQSKASLIDLTTPDFQPHRIKSVLRLARLAITHDNDTRYLAAAMRCPALVLGGGAADQPEAELVCEHERQLADVSAADSAMGVSARGDGSASPITPQDLSRITVEQVWDHASAMLAPSAATQQAGLS